MPEFVLCLLYLCAALTSFLYVASGLYAGPAWVVGTCRAVSGICEHPFLAPIALFGLGMLYRAEERRERTMGCKPARWRLTLRKWLT